MNEENMVGYKINNVGLKIFICCLLLPIFLMWGEAQGVGIESDIVKKIVNDIKNAVHSRNFKILKSYIPKKKRLFLVDCYVHATDAAWTVSFEEVEKIFVKESRNTSIYVNERPVYGDKLTGFRIKTEGWAGEEPFIEFFFHAMNGKYVLTGFCGSAKPDPNEPFGKPAKLPRPGPRVFKNIYFFHARIGEIVRLRAFEALRAYAIKRPLMMLECNKKEREVSVNEIISFLNSNSRNDEQIKFFNIHESLETEGWGGKYPFVSFRFIETEAGWMWVGIVYCKNRPAEYSRGGEIYYERY